MGPTTKERLSISESSYATPEQFLASERENLMTKYGMKAEVLDAYCKQFNITSEKGLFDRFVKNNYHKLYYENRFSKVFGEMFRSDAAIVSSMLTDKDKEFQYKYAVQIQSAMLDELACAAAGRENMIPLVIKTLSQNENTQGFNPKKGSFTNVKTNMLVMVGVAYDGVEKIGEHEKELVSADLKARYLQDTVNVLKDVLFDSTGMRKEQDMRKHMAVGMAAVGYGYFRILSDMQDGEEYKGTEILSQYQGALETFGSRMGKLDGLVKSGVIEKDDLRRFTINTFYAATYSQILTLYEDFARKMKKEGGEAKEYLEQLGLTSDEAIGERAENVAGSIFLHLLEKKYFELMRTGDQMTYNIYKTNYERRITEAMANMNFEEGCQFLMELMKSSNFADKKFKEWKAANPKGEYGDYLLNTIRKSWVEKAMPVQAGNLQLTEEEKGKYAELVFDKGFSYQDVVFAKNVLGKGLDEVLAKYAQMEKSPAAATMAKKAKELGLTPEYQVLAVKTLLPRLALIELGGATVKKNVSVLYSVEEKGLGPIVIPDIIKQAQELATKEGFEKLPADKKQMALLNQRMAIFLRQCEQRLPINFEKETVKEVEEMSAAPAAPKFITKTLPLETQDLESIKLVHKKIAPNVDHAKAIFEQSLYVLERAKGKGFEVSKDEKYNPELVSYYGIASWYLNNNRKNPDKGGTFIYGDEKLIARFEKGYSYFNANKEQVKKDVGEAEWQRLEEAADMVAKKTGQDKDKLMAGFWACQAAEYDFERFSPSLTKEPGFDINRWYAGYKNARAGVEFTPGEFAARIEKRVSEMGLAQGMYSLAIGANELFAVTVGKGGKAACELKLAKDAKVTVKTTDRLMLTAANGDIAAVSNAAMVPLLFASRKKTPDAIWAAQFVKNGDAEIGLVPTTSAAELVFMKQQVKTVQEPVPEQPVAAKRTVESVEPGVYLRPELMNIYPMPLREVPFLPYNALALPQDIVSIDVSNVWKVNLGYFGGALSKQIGERIGQMIRVDINGVITQLPTYQEVYNALLELGASEGLIDPLIRTIFTVGSNNKITGLNMDNVTLDNNKIKEIFTKLAAESLKEREGVLLGIIYRTQMLGKPLAIIPSLNVPLGKGHVLPSLTFNYNLAEVVSKNGKGYLTVTGGLGAGIEGSLYGIAGATTGYNFQNWSIYGTAGFARGAMFGGGVSFKTRKATYTFSAVGNKLLSVGTIQRETPKGVFGVSALVIGDTIIPLPFAFADATKQINKGLYHMGMRDRDLYNEPVRIPKLSRLDVTNVTPKKVETKGE